MTWYTPTFNYRNIQRFSVKTCYNIGSFIRVPIYLYLLNYMDIINTRLHIIILCICE